jgi:hypothetical protein
MLQTFENTVLSKVFGTERNEVLSVTERLLNSNEGLCPT